MADKLTISDAQLKDELIKLFESGNTDRGEIRGILGNQYKFRHDRYYTAYDTALKEWQEAKEQAQAIGIQANTLEGLKYGLKSKLERMAEIQAFLDPNYTVEDVVFDLKMGMPQYFDRKLTPTEIRAYHAELSKMGGDYAPAKIAETDVNGKDKEIVVKVIMDDND